MRLPFKYKIILGIFFIEIIFLSFIIIYNYNSIQKFTKELISNNIKTNKVLLKEMVKTPVMIYDLATLDNILEKFVDLQSVDAVRVYDARNKLLSSYNDQAHFNSESKFHELVQFKLIDDEITIGLVEMVFDLNEVYSKIDEHTKDIVRIALLEILLSILISYLIGRRLSVHLNTLDNAVKNITLSNIDIKPLNIKSKDEFEDLANSFNIMQERIQKEVEKNTKQHMQLLEQSRLASMGEMIGNIAHQWRQPLSLISSGATGLKFQKEFGNLSDEEFLRTCEMININAQYLSKTIDDFKNFIKNDRVKEEFSLISVINTFLKLIEGAAIHNDIKIINYIKDDIKIWGYPNELVQCFMNIFNNSKDALKSIEDSQKFLLIDASIKKQTIVITLKDNGLGIKENIIPHIFEPYFTTKHKSQGTGLGLSMSYNLIVDGMKGSLVAKNSKFIYNEKEFFGAEFIITLPISKLQK